LEDPAAPDAPTPDYLYPGSYDSSGNPYDGASGCSMDGQPVPCSFAMGFVNAGAAGVCPDNRCRPGMRLTDYGWDYGDSGPGGGGGIAYGVVDARTGAGWQKRGTPRQRRNDQRPQRRQEPKAIQQNPFTHPPFLKDEDKVGGCSIRVDFTDKFDESHPNGPGPYNFFGTPTQGLGFTATVSVASGGIGRIGLDFNILDPSGAWTINQKVLPSAVKNGRLVNEPREKTERRGELQFRRRGDLRAKSAHRSQHLYLARPSGLSG
jgi:hypothetical protein